jgi:3-oxoacyl-[acyl-carrier protein] reductase
MVGRLLSDGFLVSTCSRQYSASLRQFLEHPDYQSRLFFRTCSIGESDEVAIGAFGPIYGLINNAGIAQAGILTSFPNSETEKILKVNLFGAIQAARAASRSMLQSGQGGRIINIGSIIGLRGYNGLASYSASKAGLDGLTRALARELGRREITVNMIAPGYIDTDMSISLSKKQLAQIIRRTPIGRLASSDDIVNCLRFLLSDGAAMITGQTIVVDGGITC